METPYNIKRSEKTENTSDRIEFAEILGQYSCNVAKAVLDVINITIKLTKMETNVVYGDYAYLTGYYDPNTSTLTGTWRPSLPIFSSADCVCAYGIFIFKFDKRNGKIGFNGTLRNGNNEDGSYNYVEYWLGTKIQDV